MAVIKFTVPAIKNIEPTPKQTFYFDSTTPRFGLNVFPSGRKSFFIKYQNEYGRPRWYTIGNFPDMTLDQARAEARRLLVEADLGNDPSNEKARKKKAITVSELCDWYFREGVSHKKASTIANDKGRVDTLIKPLIGHIPVESLTRGHVNAMMQDIIKGDKIRKNEKSDKPRGRRVVSGGEGAAARTIQTLGAILSFAKLQGLIGDNPAHGIKKPKDKVRDIFLTRDEIKQLGQILAKPEVQATYSQDCDIIRLILLTGCRRSEILTLKWEYVDFENQVFRFPDTKTGRQNRVFGAAARKLLEDIHQRQSSNASVWVFPASRGDGPTTDILKPLKNITKTTTDDGQLILDKPNITVHSLRHTFVSLGADMGYSDIILGAIVGHRLGTVTNRYTHTVDNTLITVASNISATIQEQLDAGAASITQ